MSDAWKKELLPGAEGGELPGGYEQRDGVIGRAELLDVTDRGLWSGSEFVARSKTAHTTTAVEAAARRRLLERMVTDLDLERPILDLGCADGTFAHDLLDLGFEQLVSTDIVHSAVATLGASLSEPERERAILLVDDILKLPFGQRSFGTVVAWGVLSVSGDFERALELTWSLLEPAGHLLFAEPLLEQALVYPLVRGDLDEFRRVWRERSRPAMWDDRESRYGLNPRGFYDERVRELDGASVVAAGGINMLPSLLLGGLLQDSSVPESELEELAELLSDPELDQLALWRQAYWLVRKDG